MKEGNDMNEKDYTFVKKWKNKNHRIIKQMYPDISDEWINQFLDNEIDKNTYYLKNDGEDFFEIIKQIFENKDKLHCNRALVGSSLRLNW